MNICLKCGSEFPNSIIIEHKKRNLQKRKFCLICSPFGSHNTKDLRKQQTKKDTYKYVKTRRLKLKQFAIDLKGGKCQLCGYNKTFRSLVFHHTDTAKKEVIISRLISNCKSEANLQKELEICVLLCANCHGEVHDNLVVL